MGFWSSFANAFSKDGAATTFMEKLPLVGHGVALVHVIAGNPDHAKRAAATATNSVITTAGAVAGGAIGIVGGPAGVIAGASVGGALAAQAGMITEYGIASTIKDESIKGDVGEISLKRALTDGVIAGVSGLIGGGGGLTSAGKAAGKTAIEATGKALMKTGYESAGKVVLESATKEAAKHVTTASLASLTVGASRGAMSQAKDRKTGKPGKRVCTAAQQAKAIYVDLLCRSLHDECPTFAIHSMTNNIKQLLVETVVVGHDWAPADTLVKAQVTSCDYYYDGTVGGFAPLRERIAQEFDMITGAEIGTLSQSDTTVRHLLDTSTRQIAEQSVYHMLDEIRTEFRALDTLMDTDFAWVPTT
ncbi:hypothetical protein DFH07DRAFT_907698 [Mycena maculata]|uniref:Uncharacterized protein n=1 Tax=Mycena maculata TaxID=230809 RepID=A0AAD7KGL1_9AGAR|nr:hypothetical protein DFH07DRAFT_907698 [Mycena maculata]